MLSYNRLALAVLRRLDRIAETGRATVVRRPAQVPVSATVAALAAEEPTADQPAADQPPADAPTESALATYDEALARLAGAPDTLGARSAFDPDPELEADGNSAETHETHKARSHSDTMQVMGDPRTPLRETEGPGPVGNRSERTLSYMS